MIRALIAVSGIAFCFVLPTLVPKWQAWNAPRFKLLLLGAFVMFAVIATVISSSNIEAEFVYVSF